MLYNWARPRTVVVSQRMPAVGTSDALTPLEWNGIALLRTWQRGAVQFDWRSDQIVAEGFLDRNDPTRSRLSQTGKTDRHRRHTRVREEKIPEWQGGVRAVVMFWSSVVPRGF
jgi:hypothetical protein